MIADEIEYMDKNGKLKLFLKAGVIPVRVKCQYDIYRHYERELRLNKDRKDKIMQSVCNTSSAFKISDPTVFRAIKIMTR